MLGFHLTSVTFNTRKEKKFSFFTLKILNIFSTNIQKKSTVRIVQPRHMASLRWLSRQQLKLGGSCSLMRRVKAKNNVKSYELEHTTKWSIKAIRIHTGWFYLALTATNERALILHDMIHFPAHVGVNNNTCQQTVANIASSLLCWFGLRKQKGGRSIFLEHETGIRAELGERST